MKHEIEDHLARQTEENVRGGMSPEEAHRQAILKFGALEAVKEEYRATQGLHVFEALLRDARYAGRQLRGSPAFATAAILTLALGIGANTAIFSIVNSVMLRPLPFRDPGRLVSVRSLNTRQVPRPDELSYPDFFDFRAYNHVFDHLVSFRGDEFNLKTSAAPLHVDGEIVSWDLFPALGVSPVRGRGFLPEEEKPGTNVAVLSYSLWQSQFDGDPGLVGRSTTINGEAFTVVGIAPKGFHFPVDYPNVQIWTTLAQDATESPGVHPMTIQRGGRMIDAIARLKPGVTLDQARAQMDTIAAALARQYPESNKNVARTSIKPELEELLGFSRVPLLILMSAVGLLLLIACLNIANLLLSRTAERAREFALRAAIGASRGVILRQLLTESLLLAFLGSAAGVLLAFAAIPLVVRFAGDAVPRLQDTRVDSTVLAFAIALAVLSAVVFSLAPLVQIARIELVAFVKEGTHSIAGGRDRLRGALVIAQLALSLVLLSAASLLAATFVKIETRDPGFRPDHLLKFGVALPAAQYPIAKDIVFDDQLMQRLSTIPGVQSVASGWPLPFEGDQMKVSFDIQEHPVPMPERPHADIAIVSPGFFHTFGIPLIRGRAFTKYDDLNAPPVVIVNQAFANQFFPGENAIGKRIQAGATFGSNGPRMQTIIGIVGNARQSALNPAVDPIYYFPYKQLSWSFGWLILRTSIEPRSVEPAARAIVKALDPLVPVTNAGTMEDAFYAAVNPARFVTWLLGTFAGIALLLSMVGVYGLIAYSVSRRTREIGVRIAVGAGRGTIFTIVFKQSAALFCTGILLGASLATFADRLLERIPYITHIDTFLLLGAVSLALVITGAVTTYIPANRAASVDPVKALRAD